MNVADPDLWGHVRYGQDLLRDGYLPATSTYTFTAENYRWINHENLSEIVFALLASSFGQYGLLWFKLLASLFIFAVIALFARAEVERHWVVSIVCVAVAINLSPFWSFRPQIISYTYFVLLVALLTYSFHGWRDQWHLKWQRPAPSELTTVRLRALWAAPIIFVLWANSHGAFVAGMALFLLYMVLRAAELFIRLGRASLPTVRHLSIIAAATVLATLVNPYGVKLHLWLAEALRVPRPEVLEWAPTDFVSAGGIRFALLLAISAGSMIFSRRQKDFTQIVLMAVTAWQSIEHFRHVPFFAVLAAFWIPGHVDSALQRLRNLLGASTRVSPLPGSKLALVGSAIAGIVLVCLLAFQMRMIQVKSDFYPVAAFQFLEDRGLDGRMVVNFRWAQYALATFCAPDDEPMKSRISFDGRFRTCYPQTVLDMHFDFWLGDGTPAQRYRSPQSPPVDPTAVLQFNEPEIIIISREMPLPVRVMQSQTDRWCLLYQDALSQVWGQRSRFDDPTHADFFPKELREISDAQQLGAVSWPAFPTPRAETKRQSSIAQR
jgi:hypothetical protein